MNTAARSTIFISYSHKDEPDAALFPSADRWLSFVTSHLGPAQAHGHFELWDDRRIEGGGDWRHQIDEALSKCSVCILLVSRHSLTSSFILDVEMRKILERHYARGAHLYPIVVTPCDLDAADWLKRLNLRPHDGTALSLYPEPQRNLVMANLAAEIRTIVGTGSFRSATTLSQSQQVDIARLPETAYKRLVGRDYELERLDAAWTSSNINVLSLIAWGGAGKTALLREWIARLQRDNYRGAEAVLAWSFYDQGTKERTTSSDLFLEWALKSLDVTDVPKEATLRGELLSKTLKGRRILVALDGVEPLQFGPGPQEGLLRDNGLRVFLRRYAAEPPASAQGLVVLTSRLQVRDLGTFSGSAPTLRIEMLSEKSGAQLLADNEVRGHNEELQNASREFGGHALALSLLAAFLVRRYNGDVRRRDSVGPLLAEEMRTVDEQVHGHAKRVMRSIQSEWLKDRPILMATMELVSLFDRPARSELLNVLRSAPPIENLTETIVGIADEEWLDAIADLRAVRLLAPAEERDPQELDVHPIVRDWFSTNLEQRSKKGWQAAHLRIYSHLKKTTNEGGEPDLNELQPLYQALGHGCHARQYHDALENVYFVRIGKATRGSDSIYSLRKLGARSTDLAALSHFFEQPFDRPWSQISSSDRWQLLALVASLLGSLGRTRESERVYSELFKEGHRISANSSRAMIAGDFARTKAVLGDIEAANSIIRTSMTWAVQNMRDRYAFGMVHVRLAENQYIENKLDQAKSTIEKIEQAHRKLALDSRALLAIKVVSANIAVQERDYEKAARLANEIMASDSISDRALAALLLAQSDLGKLLVQRSQRSSGSDRYLMEQHLTEKFSLAFEMNFKAEAVVNQMFCYLSRSLFYIAAGNWLAAERDLNEAEAIIEYGRLVIFGVPAALCRARLILFQGHQFVALASPSSFNSNPESKMAAAAKQNLEMAERLMTRTGYELHRSQLNALRKLLDMQCSPEQVPPLFS